MHFPCVENGAAGLRIIGETLVCVPFADIMKNLLFICSCLAPAAFLSGAMALSQSLLSISGLIISGSGLSFS